MTIEPRLFWKTFFPIFLSFFTFRLMTQTDIIMVSYLGSLATAAFAIPARIMLIDAIFAFAIGPVISVLVASASSDERHGIIQRSLALSNMAGMVLVLLGFLTYPFLIRLVSPDPQVKALAWEAILWLTLAIPFRLGHFVGSLILNATQRGHQTIPVSLFALLLNGVLNWLLIFHFGFGFSGCFISTFIASAIQYALILRLLRKEISFKRLLSWPESHWLRSLFSYVGAEWGRLVSWQVVGLVSLMLFANRAYEIHRLTAYSVAMEVHFLIMMPFVAAMRSSAIIFSSRPEIGNAKQLFEAVRRILFCGIIVLIPFIFIIYLKRYSLGAAIYHLSGESLSWWIPFITITAIFLPFYFLDAIQKGAWQAKKKFKTLFLAEAFSDWFVYLPIIYIGLRMNHPWVTWSGLVLSKLISCGILYSFSANDKISSKSVVFKKSSI